MLRRVVSSVLALEEPYRDVVLLRFFEDLPPREVARRLGVPTETVRTRTRRALDRLRERLDAEHGGDRAAWSAALAPVAALPTVVVALSAGAKVSIGAAFVLLAGAAAWFALGR